MPKLSPKLDVLLGFCDIRQLLKSLIASLRAMRLAAIPAPQMAART
ncbi:hypothetical protein RKLH11_1752 [Rhodobacteraceae bacterium KLH11]|nr:hypothetical protein RKLH11_1752 [Rhodobacteraceae bacterium KLH11]